MRWRSAGLLDKVWLLIPREPSLRHFLAPGARSLFAAVLLSACSGPPPRTANPARALDERRAVEIIADAFREEHEQPVLGGSVSLSSQYRLKVDVGAEGKHFGVAYVTASERAQLGKTLPARDPSMGDALQLVSGIGTDAPARVCVLYDNDYLYDEASEAHEKSTLTAELKLRRDVRDFLVIAHRERLP